MDTLGRGTIYIRDRMEWMVQSDFIMILRMMCNLSLGISSRIFQKHFEMMKGYGNFNRTKAVQRETT